MLNRYVVYMHMGQYEVRDMEEWREDVVVGRYLSFGRAVQEAYALNEKEALRSEGA